MTRRTAYLSALKYHFQFQIVRWDMAPRKAWTVAKRYAAEHAFRLREEDLKNGFVDCY